MLDRNVAAKMERLSRIMKTETPIQMLERYIKILDKAIEKNVELRTELTDSLEAWKKGTV